MTYPDVPLGNQWTHPLLEADADMHAKIDVPLNAAAARMTAFGQNNVRFAAALRASVAIGDGLHVPYDTVLEDTHGGWNAATKQFTIPPAAGGMYLVNASLTITAGVSAAGPAGPIAGTIGLVGIPPNRYGAAILIGSGSVAANDEVRIPLIPIRFDGGEVIWVKTYLALHSAAWNATHWDVSVLELTQVSL